MYARLFQNAEIKAMFDRAAQTSGEQPKRLAAAILAYAKNIDKLQNLGPAVSRMVSRHIETGVKAEHYPYVAKALLPAIRDGWARKSPPTRSWRPRARLTGCSPTS